MTGIPDLGFAIDSYIGACARAGARPGGLKAKRRILDNFADMVPHKATQDLELADYERYISRWVGKAPATLATGISHVKGFSRFLKDRDWAAEDVAYPLKRPRRPRAEDADVVTISSDDARKMIDACRDWQEILCLTTALYLGARRSALSRVRRSDIDFQAGTIRFFEKGGKVVWKPIPHEYLAILRAAEQDMVWAGPQDYLIPNRRPASVSRAERSDKVIWNTVKTVAARAGVRAHVHALRAAFAVQYDEAHPGDVLALKDLLGHARIETTEIYLRRRDKRRGMERVRDLSWGGPGFESQSSGLAPALVEAHTGFEPVSAPAGIPEPIRLKLASIRTSRVRS